MQQGAQEFQARPAGLRRYLWSIWDLRRSINKFEYIWNGHDASGSESKEAAQSCWNI